ncbi:MAG: mannose-phosphate guanylyltransferase/mannose-6-phosphate isomerase [Pseudomonadota bacterium]|jgi:mannose-6-phosphate isomerase-like protein (cupin superfamily)
MMQAAEALARPTGAVDVSRGLYGETRPWGSWRVLAESPGYKVKILEVLPGQRLSLQYHHHRSEHWVVIAGTARVCIAERYYDMHTMQSVLIPARTIHRIENPYSEVLQIVEVQRGDILDEEDIVRLEDDYQRTHLAGASRGSGL